MIRFLEPDLAEPNKHYWILNNGYLVEVPYNCHNQYCIQNNCDLKDVEQQCIRVHQPIGEKRLYASSKRKKYTNEQIKTLALMDWVILESEKL